MADRSKEEKRQEWGRPERSEKGEKREDTKRLRQTKIGEQASQDVCENEEKFEYIDWERKIQEHSELLEKEESERKDKIEKKRKK